jgi:hypothetical protein
LTAAPTLAGCASAQAAENTRVYAVFIVALLVLLNLTCNNPHFSEI